MADPGTLTRCLIHEFHKVAYVCLHVHPRPGLSLTSSTDATSPDAASSNTTGPKTVGPETVGPETMGPETVGPETVGSHATRLAAVTAAVGLRNTL